VTGLEAVEAQLAGAKTSLDLSKSRSIQVDVAGANVSEIAYRVVVKQNGSVVGERAGSLTLTGAAIQPIAVDANAVSGWEMFACCMDSDCVKRFNVQTGEYIDDRFQGNGVGGPNVMLFLGDVAYIGCGKTNSVRRFNARTGQFIDAFVPSGSGGLQSIDGMAFGPDGNLYLASYWSNSVKRYNGKTGAYIDDFIPGGKGGLAHPCTLLFRLDGKLYVLSNGNALIKRYDAKTGTFLDDFAGGNGLRYPYECTFGPDGNLYVSSRDTHEVKRFNGKTGEYMGNFVTARSGDLTEPTGVAFGPDGNLYVSGKSSIIRRYDGRTGAFMNIFAQGGRMIYPEHMEFRRVLR
jgi:streptogramin lyase